MQPGSVAAWTGRGLAGVVDWIVELMFEAGRCEYAKGQESCGMLRKHPKLLSLSVPPHKR